MWPRLCFLWALTRTARDIFVWLSGCLGIACHDYVTSHEVVVIQAVQFH